MKRAAGLELGDGKRGARADDDDVLPRLAPQRVERLAAGDAEALSLAGCEAPEAAVPPQLAAVGVDDRAVPARQAAPLEEVAIVAAGQEARLLALGAAGRRQPGARGLGPRLVLGLAAEREVEPAEEARVDRASMYDWSLRSSAARASKQPALALDDARVVAGREPRGAGALGKGDQLVETEAAVAADAGVRRLTGRVAARRTAPRPRRGTPRVGRA